MHNLLKHHWKTIKHILRYLVDSVDHGLLIRKCQHFHIPGFSDADWDSEPDDRKSTTKYCIHFGFNLAVVQRRHIRALLSLWLN